MAPTASNLDSARYIPAALADARVAAMRLRQSLPDLSPSQARNVVARMFGASDWAALRHDVFELEQSASRPDSAVDAATRQRRREAQAKALIPVLEDLWFSARPAARRGESDANGDTDHGADSALDNPAEDDAKEGAGNKKKPNTNAAQGAPAAPTQQTPKAAADPSRKPFLQLLASALAQEVQASDPEGITNHSSIDWLQRPPVARTDLLGNVATNWWLRWRRLQLVGSEALAQTADDVDRAERLLEIDVSSGSPSSLLRFARAWGELAQLPGVGQPIPEEAIAFVLDRVAVEYACERARRADAWRAFTERRSRLEETERARLESAFDRELWALACELLATQPCIELAETARRQPGAFRELAQRGRSRFEPGLRALAKAATP